MSFGYQVLGFGAFPNRGATYNVTSAAMFARGSSQYLSRTHSASNRDTWTFATWFKIANDGSNELGLFSGGADINNSSRLVLDASRNLKYQHFDSGSTTDHVGTTQVFRDVGAWYHVVLAVDTTQATEANRVRIYVNGSEVTSFGTSNYPARNVDTDVNSNDVHLVGSDEQPNYFNGYITETVFIDGAQLTAASFGEFDGDSGIWVPKDVSGLTFGTNGFLLRYNGINVGIDTSGEGNNWTANKMGPNNIVVDACSNVSNEIFTLYPTWDYKNTSGAAHTFASNNLTASIVYNSSKDWLPTTIPVRGGSGIFYWETKPTTITGATDVSLIRSDIPEVTQISGSDEVYGLRYQNSNKQIRFNNAIVVTATNGYSADDVIGTLLDSTNGRLYFSINDSWQDGTAGGASSGTVLTEIQDTTNTNYAVPTFAGTVITQNDWFPGADNPHSGTDVVEINFGHLADFAGTMPSNASKLSTTITGSGNWATWSPTHHNHVTSQGTLTNGNLDITNTGNNIVFSTHKGSGKQYIEFKVIDSSSFAGSRFALGIMSPYVRVNQDQSMLAASGGTFSGVSLPDYTAFEDGADQSENYDNLIHGQTLCMAIDFDAGKMWTRVNGAAYDNKTGGTGNPVNGDHPTLTFTAAVNFPYLYCTFCFDSDDQAQTNFGQKPFRYTPPTGYTGVFSTDMTAPAITKPSDFFAPIIYTGNATDDTAIAVGFQPDFTLIKNTSQADHWKLIDSVRGATKNMAIEDGSGVVVENTEAAGLKAFTSTGFTLGTGANGYNDNSEGFVSFNWKAGGAPSADNSGSAGGAPTANSVMVDGSSNTADLVGSKAALRISANTESGFAIVRWDSSANAAVTIDHKLGKVPKMYWVKALDEAYGWYVYHVAAGNTHYLLLKDNNAKADEAYWNDTTPTSTVFSVSSASALEGVNHTGKDFLAYLWAEVEGFSRIGEYVGNGNADGPFVYCGFKPATIIIKEHDGTGEWRTYNNKIDGYNPTEKYLRLSTAEANNTGGDIDFLSNGFKLRNTGAEANGSADKYAFAAWAESPFASNNRAR